MCVGGGGGRCVCVCTEVTEVYDTMSCLPIMSDRAANEGSKYLSWGGSPTRFLTRNTCSVYHHLVKQNVNIIVVAPYAHLTTF